MRRVAFQMTLFKGCCEEYKKRHDAIWPELCRELKAAGISDYSIFLDEETLTLFAVQKLTDAKSETSRCRSRRFDPAGRFISLLLPAGNREVVVVC